LRLSTRAVEGKHQLAAHPFPERMARDQRLELPDEIGVVPECEISIDARLESREPKLLEPRALAPAERLSAELSERRSTPQRERLAQGRACELGVPFTHRPSPSSRSKR